MYSTLLKVVNYYDLSVLYMSVMGFKKKKFGWGVGGWGELHPSLFWIFLTLQTPNPEPESLPVLGLWHPLCCCLCRFAVCFAEGAVSVSEVLVQMIQT